MKKRKPRKRDPILFLLAMILVAAVVSRKARPGGQDE